MNNAVKFILSTNKAKFEELLLSDPTLENAIAFIELESLIYAKGKYYSAFLTKEYWDTFTSYLQEFVTALVNSDTEINTKLSGKIFGQEKLLTDQNLDNLYNITDVGLYYAYGSNNVTGKPSNVDNFTLSIYRSGSGTVHQVLFAGDTCKMYVRYWEAGKWITSWIEIGSGSTTNKWTIIE